MLLFPHVPPSRNAHEFLVKTSNRTCTLRRFNPLVEKGKISLLLQLSLYVNNIVGAEQQLAPTFFLIDNLCASKNGRL